MEAFVTAVAGKRLVVRHHVFLQLVSIMETLVADLTEDAFQVVFLFPPPVPLLLFTVAPVLRGAWGERRR